MKFGAWFAKSLISSKTLLSTMLAVSSIGFPSFAYGQFNFPFNNFRGVVGGVSIDSEGVVRDAKPSEQEATLRALRSAFKGASKELSKSVAMRMVSLRGLQEELAKAHREGRQPSEDTLFLGGLTRIEYVFVYPEQKDIVFAGPAENWTVSEKGSIVGQASGRPVIYLDDVLTAFRSLDAARTEGVSVSIDPTPEGIARLQALQKQVASFQPQMESAYREAFGPQTVRLTGVPANSHMAQVLLASDYQMKRYGMNLAKAPVKGLPSYVEMIANSSGAPQSRWWMACDYAAVEHTKDALAWKISGRGIKTLTEDEMTDPQGNRKQTGKSNAKAQKWADNFTEKLDQIALKETVFGELRNVMDLCVIAALIESKGLEQLAGCDLSVLRGKKESVEMAKFESPKTLPAQCSFLKTANGWIVTTSGGVMVDGWSVSNNTKVNEALEDIRSKVISPTASSWCWN